MSTYSNVRPIDDVQTLAKTIRDRQDLVRSFIRARRLRDACLNPELFADPAWDMLLELYSVALDQRRISVTKLCHASCVPETTALRWIEKLACEDLIIRRPDAMDGRRVWIELSQKAFASMQRYFDVVSAAY